MKRAWAWACVISLVVLAWGMGALAQRAVPVREPPIPHPGLVRPATQGQPEKQIQITDSKNKPEYKPGELLVRFEPTMPKSWIGFAHTALRADVVRSYRLVNNLQLVRLPEGLTVEEAIKGYLRQPGVLYAEPNYILWADATPNDALFSGLWALHNTGQTGGTPDADIDAPEAWNLTTGSNDVVVAVLDTGIDYSHPDLAANMFLNMVDCNSNGLDDDSNGYVDDCYGIDAYHDDSDPMDDNGHGTHVAGTIGAIGNNGVGVVGINWTVRLLACKFLDKWGGHYSLAGLTSDAVECLDYVREMKDRGANIIATSNSWGLNLAFPQSLYDAIEAHKNAGILFVAAAGNDAYDNDFIPNYPSNYDLPNIIAVAASTSTDSRAEFSNFGRQSVDLGAPGTSIWSTIPGSSYTPADGTSMAAPHVTGVAALLKAYSSGWDWKAIKNRILAGGDDVVSMVETVTQKRLNAYGSLTCSDRTVRSRLLPVEETVAGTVGMPIDLAVLHINCDTPNGTVQVTVDPGAEIITLTDDGLGADQEAGDGIYTGQWTPASETETTLTFPDSDVVTVVFEDLAHDDFANAKVISSVPYTDTILNTTEATTDGSDPVPSCGGGSRGKSVWYQFTPVSDGTVTATTIGSNYDTVLSAWTGSPGAFTQEACNDDWGTSGTGLQSRVSFSVTGDVTYYFMVSAYNNDGGVLVFNLDYSPQATNDNFADATVVSSLPYTDSVDTTQATTDEGDPVPSCGGGYRNKSVWYQFTPTEDMTIVADTHGSNYDTVLSAWTGSPGDFAEVDCNNDSWATGNGHQSQIIITVTGDVTYYFMISQLAFDTGGVLVFNLYQAPSPPPNDDFADATIASGLPYTDGVDTTTATTEPSDPVPSGPGCGAEGNSAWYRFTPASAGTLTANLNGSNYRSYLSAWTGEPGAFTEVACDSSGSHHGDSEIFFSVTGGTTYHFMIRSWESGGNLVFNLGSIGIIDNPAPTPTTLDPSNTVWGGPEFTLTVHGSDFVSDSKVRWNGSDRETAFVTSSQLRATIEADDIATPGTAQVTVFSPAPGGGTSDPLTFTITDNPVPILTALLSPSSINEVADGFTLTALGSGFVSDSVVRWNGADCTTSFVSDTQLGAYVPTSQVAGSGTAMITVFNPSPGGGTSDPLPFTYDTSSWNPAPTITTVSFPGTTTPEEGLALAVHGSGFVPGAVVRWNGRDLATRFASSTYLLATVPAGEVRRSPQGRVSVFNPEPGGGVSNVVTITTRRSPRPSLNRGRGRGPAPAAPQPSGEAEY